jgi:hypothetical protein
MIRAAMWTAIPPTSSPRNSTSPVWIPARIPIPSSRRSRLRPLAHEMALPGGLEHGQHPVARGLDQLSLLLFHQPPSRPVVPVQDLPPADVPDLLSPIGRADDVRDQHGGQATTGPSPTGGHHLLGGHGQARRAATHLDVEAVGGSLVIGTLPVERSPDGIEELVLEIQLAGPSSDTHLGRDAGWASDRHVGHAAGKPDGDVTHRPGQQQDDPAGPAPHVDLPELETAEVRRESRQLPRRSDDPGPAAAQRDEGRIPSSLR